MQKIINDPTFVARIGKTQKNPIRSIRISNVVSNCKNVKLVECNKTSY